MSGGGEPVLETQRSVRNPEEMHALGAALGAQLRAGDLVILTGSLGAGKTTLSRGIGEGLSVRGPITSPTFVLARTHPALGDGPPLVHVDAYRLGDAAELDDLDLDFEGSVVVAEWGAGLVETQESWLELTIERPTGDLGAGLTSSGGEGVSDWSEEPIEPRLVTVRGFGSRWVGTRIT